MKRENYEWHTGGEEVPPPNVIVEIEVKLKPEWEALKCSLSHLGYRTRAKRVKVHEYETEPIKDGKGNLLRMKVIDKNVIRWRNVVND